MIVILNVDSTYVPPIFGESMIIWHMTNLPAGVSTVASIVQYVWKTLMHSGWSMAEKSVFLLSSKVPSVESPFQE
jgi:hypothetical protein